MEGFHPDQRARLVFQAPPSTFRELELLTIVDRNIAFADHLRASSAGQSTVNAIHQRTQRPSQQTSNVMVKQSTKSGNRPVCFYCNKPGHFQRNCHLRRSSNSSTFKYTMKGSEDDQTHIYSKHTLISLCPRIYTYFWSSPLFLFFWGCMFVPPLTSLLVRTLLILMVLCPVWVVRM